MFLISSGWEDILYEYGDSVGLFLHLMTNTISLKESGKSATETEMIRIMQNSKIKLIRLRYNVVLLNVSIHTKNIYIKTIKAPGCVTSLPLYICVLSANKPLHPSQRPGDSISVKVNVLGTLITNEIAYLPSR